MSMELWTDPNCSEVSTCDTSCDDSPVNGSLAAAKSKIEILEAQNRFLQARVRELERIGVAVETEVDSVHSEGQERSAVEEKRVQATQRLPIRIKSM